METTEPPDRAAIGEQICQDLLAAADSYLASARRGPSSEWIRPPVEGFRDQAELGCWLIALELLLKAMIARKCPAEVFALSRSLGMWFKYPELPFDQAEISAQLSKIQTWGTLQFDEARGLATAIYPELAGIGRLDDCRRIRNAAVHGVFPPTTLKGLGWVRACFGQTALVAVKHLRLPGDMILLSNTVYMQYEVYVRTTLRHKTEEAHQQAIKAAVAKLPGIQKNRETTAECPVCHNQGIVRGRWSYHTACQVLTRYMYYPQSFECPTCHLSLDSPEQFHAAIGDAYLKPEYKGLPLRSYKDGFTRRNWTYQFVGDEVREVKPGDELY